MRVREYFVAALVCALIISMYAWMGLFFSEPPAYPDSREYMSVAAEPIFSRELWAGIRAPLPVLFFKLLAAHVPLIPAVQSVLSALAWTFLIMVVGGRSKTLAGALLGGGSLMLYALADNLALWHGLILSESLCLTILVSLVAAGVLYLEKQTRARFLLLLGLVALFVFVRDTNAYVLLAVGALAGCIELIRRPGSRARWQSSRLLLAAACLTLFLLSVASHTAGRRWLFPFFNNMSQRILPSEESKAFFVRHGMPVNSTLEGLAGKWASSDGRLYYNSPDLEAFRQWTYARGKRTYVLFLLANPLYSIRAPYDDFSGILAQRYNFYAADGYASLLPEMTRHEMTSSARMALWALTSLLIFGSLICCRTTHALPLVHMALLLGATGIAHYYLAWHGDAMEIERHSLIALVQMQLALLLGGVVFLDRFFFSKLRRPQTTSCARPNPG